MDRLHHVRIGVWIVVSHLLGPVYADSIPEPGAIFYGTVRAGAGVVNSGTLSVTVQSPDGRRLTVVEPLASPYLLRIPFEQELGSSTVSASAFKLQPAQTEYTITEILVNGAPAQLANPAQATFPLRIEDRARVIAMDINVSVVSASAFLSDRDGDGLPDAWELAHGLNPNDPSDAESDPDGDGMSTHNEHLAGTDPKDVRSVLRMGVSLPTLNAGRALGLPETVGYELTWSSVAGRSYRIERAPSVSGPFVVILSGIRATPPMNVFTDLDWNDSETAYYRISLE